MSTRTPPSGTVSVRLSQPSDLSLLRLARMAAAACRLRERALGSRSRRKCSSSTASPTLTTAMTKGTPPCQPSSSSLCRKFGRKRRFSNVWQVRTPRSSASMSRSLSIAMAVADLPLMRPSVLLSSVMLSAIAWTHFIQTRIFGFWSAPLPPSAIFSCAALYSRMAALWVSRSTANCRLRAVTGSSPAAPASAGGLQGTGIWLWP
mmetsp:Transcript_95109/g.307081  ORF Transcript_95109/g.307081 Transcript_95109/m.307081 type:complete len:205 (-) Transcript_95109:207-821(-)